MARLHPSYISRLEAGKWNAKHATVDRILAALGATPSERKAVFHEDPRVDRPTGLPPHLEDLATRFNAKHEPISILDGRWFRVYENPSFRSALGFADEEHRRSIGEHVLHSVIDPDSPFYSRTLDSERAILFGWRAAAFRTMFAEEEFDRWYLEVVDKVLQIPWAARIWSESLPNLPEYIDRTEVTIVNPVVGLLRFRVQTNRLLREPSFAVVTWAPLDKQTAARLAQLGFVF